MIKFAKSRYNSFSDRHIGFNVECEQVFAVTPEIESKQWYQDGIATKNFIPVTIANECELTKVVNLSDAVRAEFAKTQPPKVPVVPIPVAQIPIPIDTPKPAPVMVDEPTLSFTEEAGNQKSAFEAISKMTDMKKLEYALKIDNRVGVQKALHKRIEELKA